MFGINAQDAEFTKQFINQTHITLNKAQKELIRSNSVQFESQFKEAILLQTAAVKSYDKSHNESFMFSYRSRELCLKMLDALNPASVKGYSISSAELEIQEQNKTNRTNKIETYITDQEKEYVSKINILEPGSIQTLLLNLN